MYKHKVDGAKYTVQFHQHLCWIFTLYLRLHLLQSASNFGTCLLITIAIKCIKNYLRTRPLCFKIKLLVKLTPGWKGLPWTNSSLLICSINDNEIFLITLTPGQQGCKKCHHIAPLSSAGPVWKQNYDEFTHATKAVRILRSSAISNLNIGGKNFEALLQSRVSKIQNKTSIIML